MSHAFFVAGTDTEIGKTTVTAGLTYLCGQAGYSSLAVKPIAAGQRISGGRWINDDVEALLAASNLALQDTDVGPLQLRTACAPHIAAQQEGVRIDRDAVLSSVRRVAELGDVCFVEGVGGFSVPLTPGWNTADLATDLAMPVILVVGLRLGCINHASLTAEAVRARSLTLAGWVANLVDPAMQYVEDNVVSLNQCLQAPCLGFVPHLVNPTAAQVALHLRMDAINFLLETP